MAPYKYRGAINNGFQLCVGIGVLSANLINYGTEKLKNNSGWRISFGSIFLPETPNSLIQRCDEHQKAKKMLQRIRGTDDVDAEFEDLVKANATSKTIEKPFVKITQQKYRPQFVMAIAIQFFQQVTGINVISFYAPILFTTVGLDESASLLSADVTGVVGTVATFISMLIVDKLGRRVLFAIGGVQMFVSQIVIGSIMAANFHNANFLFTFAIAQSFLSMLCHLKSGTFFFFGGWVLIMTAFVLLF